MVLASDIQQAAAAIRGARNVVALTGAGISVESGIPPFRGSDGLWERVDPSFIEINYFYNHPQDSWRKIREIFYQFMGQAEPNAAHRILAQMEQQGLLDTVITQNIDNLHQRAGSRQVIEFHGTTGRLICTGCGKTVVGEDTIQETIQQELPPKCSDCGGLIKPDFVFFGEMIPESASQHSFQAAETADVFLIIGTSAEVYPAALLPSTAKQRGATLIEINTAQTTYTQPLTDIFLKGKATDVMQALGDELGLTND